MANTYTLISSQTLGSAASSVTFSSIPSTYTDILIRCSVRSDRASQPNSYIKVYPNGSSASITYRSLEGNGSSASSFTEAAAAAFVAEIPASTATSSTFGNIDIYFPNYASSNNKSFSTDGVSENNATFAQQNLTASLWSNTTAISSVQLLDGLANFVTGSTFYLYGIKNS